MNKLLKIVSGALLATVACSSYAEGCARPGVKGGILPVNFYFGCRDESIPRSQIVCVINNKRSNNSMMIIGLPARDSFLQEVKSITVNGKQYPSQQRTPLDEGRNEIVFDGSFYGETNFHMEDQAIRKTSVSCEYR